MREPLKIGVIGANGWLGGAIVQALLDAGITSPEHLVLSLRSGEPTRFPGARWTRDNQDLADSVDLIVVSVRPVDWPALNIEAAGRLIISVMAGIRLEQLVAGVGSDRVVRSLPNAAAEVRASFTPWVASAAVSAEERRLVGRIFEACGTSAELESESELDYLTGLAGSGPAFPALLAVAMARHAAAHGIEAKVARQAVTQLLIGTGRLFEKNGYDPANTVEVFLDYRPEGFQARIRIPGRYVTTEGVALTAAKARRAETPVRAPERMLVLEDNMIIALEAEDMFRRLGFERVDVAAHQQDAERFIRENTYDVVALDLNLGSSTSLALADELHRSGIPFLFATGYGEGAALPERFAGIPIVAKPYSDAALFAALASLIDGKEPSN